MKSSGSAKKRKIQNYSFITTDLLGQGSYGNVYKGYDDVKNQEVAIKVIEKDSLQYSQYLKQALRLEVNILNKMKSPNIVALKQFIVTQNRYYLILEYCNEGDFEKLLRKEKRLPQQKAILYMSQILTGFYQLIRNGIVHRDLKPQNILIKDGILKIADFGIAKPVNQQLLLTSMVGTVYYQSPQLLNQEKYTYKCDIWALGLIFYEMLYGQTPWKYGGNKKTYLENIKTKKIQFPNQPYISQQSKKFIINCLDVNQESRLSWQQVFQCEIFKGKLPKLKNIDSKFKYAMTKLRNSIHSNNLDIERFFHKLKVQKKGQMNISQFSYLIQRISGDLTNYECKNIFDKVDKDKNGSIDLQQLKQSLKESQIRTESLNGRDFKRFLKKIIDQQIDKTNIEREELLIHVTDKLRYQMQKKQIYDLYEIFRTSEDLDGYLSLEALHSLLCKIDHTITKVEAEIIFEKFDQNKDNKISFQQFYRNMCIITGTPIMSKSAKIS